MFLRKDSSPDKTVYVCGAGFSRAFVPTAPLANRFLAAHLNLLEESRFKPVKDFIESTGLQADSLNIETLFTLAALNPPWLGNYESLSQRIAAELLMRLLNEIIGTAFKTEIRPNGKWRFTVDHDAELCNFARILLSDRFTHVITFNYDVLLENFLEQESRNTADVTAANIGTFQPRFDSRFSFGFTGMNLNPDNGVIFKPSIRVPHNGMFLLKLHGSTSWIARKSAGQPIHTDDILTLPCHDSFEPFGFYDVLYDQEHSFLIPPVLDKSSMLIQPVISVLWNWASLLLEKAEEIIFLGYSFPPTDYHAEFLFRRYANKRAKFKVVNYVDKAQPDDKQSAQKAETIGRYRAIFPAIADADFNFEGVAAYVKNLPHADIAGWH